MIRLDIYIYMLYMVYLMISILATIWQSKNPRHLPWYPCRYIDTCVTLLVSVDTDPPLRNWTWIKLNASSIPPSLAAKIHALACTWLKCNYSPLNFLIPHVSGKKNTHAMSQTASNKSKHIIHPYHRPEHFNIFQLHFQPATSWNLAFSGWKKGKK